MKAFVWPLTLLALSPVLVLAKPVSYQQDVAGKQLKLQLEGVSQKDWQARLPQFQHWLAAAKPKQHELIQLCEEWRMLSQQSYSCRLGAIAQQWHQAAKNQVLPDRVELRRQTRAIEQQVVSAANYNTVVWQLDGLANARLLDDTSALLKSWFPTLKQMDLQSGVSRLLWSDALSTKLSLGTEQPLLQQLQLSSVALAQTETADTQQGYKVSYRTFSPLLNPAEGWPVEYGPTATVLAKDAVTAYLLAQSLAVLDLKQGQQLTDQQQAAALIKTDSANWYASNSWYDYLADKSQSQQQGLQIREHGLPIAPPAPNCNPRQPLDRTLHRERAARVVQFPMGARMIIEFLAGPIAAGTSPVARIVNLDALPADLDAYLAQSEAALPVLSHREVFVDPRRDGAAGNKAQPVCRKWHTAAWG